MSYHSYTRTVRLKGEKGEIEIKDSGYEYNDTSGAKYLLAYMIEQYNKMEPPK